MTRLRLLEDVAEDRTHDHDANDILAAAGEAGEQYEDGKGGLCPPQRPAGSAVLEYRLSLHELDAVGRCFVLSLLLRYRRLAVGAVD